MFTRSQVNHTNDVTTTTMTTRPMQVVDVDEWLVRAASPVRAFAPNATLYVPRHRGEPVKI